MREWGAQTRATATRSAADRPPRPIGKRASAGFRTQERSEVISNRRGTFPDGDPSSGSSRALRSITVAGAVSGSHRLPNSPTRKPGRHRTRAKSSGFIPALTTPEDRLSRTRHRRSQRSGPGRRRRACTRRRSVVNPVSVVPPLQRRVDLPRVPTGSSRRDSNAPTLDRRRVHLHRCLPRGRTGRAGRRPAGRPAH